MSLVALALRIVTCRALRGATLAGDRVFDSAIAPIGLQVPALANLIEGEKKPIIVIYTDHDAGEVQGRDLLAIERGENAHDGFDLTIHAAVVSASKVKARGEYAETDEDEIEVTVPPTDEGLEVSLNLMNRQIVRVLVADPGPWSEMWRRLVLRITRSVTNRGADIRNSIRFAATERVLACDVIAEPPFGAEPKDIWADLIALLRTDDELKRVADILDAEIREPGGLADWNQLRADLGLTAEGAVGIGIAPAFDTQTEPAPATTEMTAADTETGATLVITPEDDEEA